ncbi:MAG: tetratricopeptide repeat protein [Prevotellaceae bacterium]|jgi:tetratricopeptide (TPR) repeat protein|nr:tetratricopeptide repeat protein [Prevotellaceae bacterium]
MSKQIKTQADPEQAVGRTLSNAEQFLEKNKNILLYTLIALGVVVSIYFGYQKLYKEPLKEEALGQMFAAEQYFRLDSFALALNGDGNAYGFLQIRDEYGSNAGKILPFYIGYCQLHLGQYEEAIASLQSYKGSDEIVAARAMAGIGDAYVELSNLETACSWFTKAANYRDNSYTARYLMKAAAVREEQGNIDDALKLYERIKLNYSQTAEGREIDKYIARLTIDK